jgi:hypothetical protein
LIVESEIGHGAAFIIDLPAIEELPSIMKTARLTENEQPLTKKAGKMVADDEAAVRMLIDKVLTQIDYLVPGGVVLNAANRGAIINYVGLFRRAGGS